jgi:hypothetical protein
LSRSKFGKRGCVGTFSVSTIHPRKTAHCLHRMDLDCGISSASGNLSNYGGTTNKRARAHSRCGFQNRKANFCPSPAQDHTSRHSKNLERCGPSATRFSILLEGASRALDSENVQLASGPGHTRCEDLRLLPRDQRPRLGFGHWCATWRTLSKVPAFPFGGRVTAALFHLMVRGSARVRDLVSS